MLKEGIGDHGHQRMAVETLPGAALEVVETEFLLHLLMRLFTDPARLDGSRECFERSVGGQVRHVVLLLSAQSSFPDQPNLLAWHALNAIIGHPVLVAIGNSHAPRSGMTTGLWCPAAK